ncbi:MAG: STAS domain-containing protein [Pseudonocardiaceae bacterium]
MTSDDVHLHTRPGSRGEHIVTVTGQVDVVSAPAFGRLLAAAAAGRHQLIADLTGLGFLDSAGVRVLFELATRLDLHLIVDPSSVVATTLDICGIGEAATLRAASP